MADGIQAEGAVGIEVPRVDAGRAVPAERLPVQAQHSIMGKVARRSAFASRYMRSWMRRDVLKRFKPILAKHFEHEWVSGVGIRMRFLPGTEEKEIRIPWRGGQYLMKLRWMPWREEGCSAHWGGPITVSVYKHGKDGGKPVQVRYMSLFIQNGIVLIAQLQGVFMIEMPKGLRDWAERFVKATMEFAEKEGFKGVWVIRAGALYSYHHPTIRWFLPEDVKERERKRIRSNMESYHDETARGLGFRLEGEWYKWEVKGESKFE